MPEGMSAQGTIVQVSPDPNWPTLGAGDPVNFVSIAELRDITPPALTRNIIETTTQNEGDDAHVVGIRRHGELELDMNFVPQNATHDETDGLQGLWFRGERNIYRLIYPEGSAWLFSGYVASIAPSAPLDDRLSASVTIRPTGRHDWTTVP